MQLTYTADMFYGKSKNELAPEIEKLENQMIESGYNLPEHLFEKYVAMTIAYDSIFSL